MALMCPVDLDTQLLRSEVSKIYGRVAVHPEDNFPLGADFSACEQ